MERPFKLHKRLVTTTLLKVRPALATCLPFKKYRLRVTDPSTDPYCVTLGRKKKQTKDGEKMQTTKQLVVFFLGGGGHPILPPQKKKRINFTKLTVKRLEPLDGFGRCVCFFFGITR